MIGHPSVLVAILMVCFYHLYVQIFSQLPLHCTPYQTPNSRHWNLHFGLKNLSDLPNQEELKASGFLDKRSAIATISDLAKNDDLSGDIKDDDQEDNNLDDFVQKI